MKNCRFYNNTSDSLFTTKPYQGSAGGFSAGYNFPFTKVSPVHGDNSFALVSLFAHITNCTFTDNSALLPAGQGETSAGILRNNMFRGCGGAFAVLVNTYLNLTFEFSDNIVMNNFAEALGGGVFCLNQKGSFQMYIFNNNAFMNNAGLRAGGLALIYITIPTIAIYNDFYNCTFYNNTVSQMAGAIAVAAVFGLGTNIFITFKECNFLNNTAMIYGGAVDTTLFIFEYTVQAESLIAFINWLAKI